MEYYGYLNDVREASYETVRAQSGKLTADFECLGSLETRADTVGSLEYNENCSNLQFMSSRPPELGLEVPLNQAVPRENILTHCGFQGCRTADCYISEIHYRNAGPDANEFVEVICKEASAEFVRDFKVFFYGSSGEFYASRRLSAFSVESCEGGICYAVLAASSGDRFQQDSGSGIALVDASDRLIEFLTYGGSTTGTNGPAEGFTSVDIGVEETEDSSSTDSLQRQTDGTWTGPIPNTRGAMNQQVFDPPRINEFHYDNAGLDQGEFIEMDCGSETFLDGYTILLYNQNGNVYGSFALGTCTNGFYVLNLPENGMNNGNSGICLYDGTAVVDSIGIEGSLVASSGECSGISFVDIGVSEPKETAVGQSLQRCDDGGWVGPDAESKGSANSAACSTR